jgi:hypothetical protein
MIHPLAFANAIAATTAALTLFLCILRAVAPPVFTFFFNAQFFGADVGSLLPTGVSVGRMAGEVAALVAGAWGIGYLWAVLYNRWAK